MCVQLLVSMILQNSLLMVQFIRELVQRVFLSVEVKLYYSYL